MEAGPIILNKSMFTNPVAKDYEKSNLQTTINEYNQIKNNENLIKNKRQFQKHQQDFGVYGNRSFTLASRFRAEVFSSARSQGISTMPSVSFNDQISKLCLKCDEFPTKTLGIQQLENMPYKVQRDMDEQQEQLKLEQMMAEEASIVTERVAYSEQDKNMNINEQDNQFVMSSVMSSDGFTRKSTGLEKLRNKINAEARGQAPVNYEKLDQEARKAKIQSDWGPKPLQKSTLSTLEKCVLGERSKASLNKREVCKKQIHEKIFGKPRVASTDELMAACFETHPEAFAQIQKQQTIEPKEQVDLNRTFDCRFLPQTHSKQATKILQRYAYQFEKDNDSVSVSSKFPWPEKVKYGLKTGTIHAYPNRNGGEPVLYSDKSMLRLVENDSTMYEAKDDVIQGSRNTSYKLTCIMDKKLKYYKMNV